MQSKKLLTRRRLLELRKLVIVTMVFLLSLSNFLPYSAQYAQANETPSLSDLELTQDVDGEERKEVEKGATFTFNVNALIPEDGSNEGTLTILNQVDKQLTIENVEVVVNEEESDLEATVEGQDVSLDLTPEQLDTVAGQHVTMKITAAFQDEAEAGTEIENVAEAFINGELAEKAEPVTVALLADAEATSEEETTEEEAQQEEENAGEESSEEEQVSEEEQSSEGEQATEEEAEGEEVQASNVAENNDMSATAVPSAPIDQHPKVTMLDSVGEGKYIGADYSFTPRVTDETEVTVTPGPNTRQMTVDEMCSKVTQSTCDSWRAHTTSHFFEDTSGERSPSATLTFTNVGIYNNQKIDMMVETTSAYTDVLNSAFDVSGASRNSSASEQTAFTRKVTFISQETGQPIEVKGYISFRGINAAKTMLFDLPIKDIYAINGSTILYDNVDSNGEPLFVKGTAPGGTGTPDTMLTLVFEPTSTITFTQTYAGASNVNQTHGTVIDQFSLTGIDFPVPVKSGFTVEDKEVGESEYPDPREAIYEIVQVVPYADQVNYYDSFEITDTLDDVLVVEDGDIKIKNTTGEDVTNLFDISVVDHQLSIQAKADTLSNASFYNQQYTITVNGALNITSEYDKYIDEDGFVSVPNTATTVVDNESKSSNEAYAKFKYDEEEPVDPPDIDACANPVALVNGSFEELAYSPDDPRTPTGPGWTGIQDEYIPGWTTTDSTGRFDIFVKSLMDKLPDGDRDKHEVIHGQQFAEMNSFENATLYQDVQTTPGQTIYWRLAHKGRYGVDTMAVKIGSNTTAPKSLPIIETMSTGKDAWEYYTGTYTVPADQTVTRFGFEAISSATGDIRAGNFIDDIFLGTEPCVVAEKSVSPEGEVFEGDELTYEVTVKNNGGDVAANTVIEDAIPEGTEFVPGSMKILNGPKRGDLTDENDDDAGHFDGDKVIINIGEVPNATELEEGITVQFKVKALSSHVGESVVNKATVGYKNLLTDEDGTTETNEVSNDIIEREDIDACANPVALVNGSFEEPTARMPGDTGSPGHEQFWMYFLEDEVPGWKTNASDKLIQIMKNEYIYQYQINPPHGNQYAELNAHQVSALYQDVETTPGQTIYWRLAHRGLMGVDTMNVQIGSADVAAEELPVIEQVSTDKTEWVYYSGSYTVPAGQTVTRFAFNSVDAAGGSQMFGNLLDDIFLGTEPCVVAEKSVSPEGEVAVGDELTYEVTIKNNGGDIAANTVFEDAIPEGTEYVPGSMKILTGPKAGDLTDADDNDAGHFDGDKVIINLGDLPNTTELPDGVTVQFKVKTISDNGGEPVVNKATVDYKNLLTDEDGSTETNEVETPVQYNAPKTESEKSAELLEKADGNTDADNPEVGDTLKYTIQTRNTVENSLITNLTIRDVIPEGLEYVPGTLKVNGEAVTDEKDDDEGHVVDGEVFGSFGDVTNTEWHTLEFQVIVSEGQAGNDIENVAVVDGDNLDEPDEPREEVKVYPREPKTESKKSAKNADDSKEHYEVGDTVIYTIEARNTVSDSLLENLKITDVLPEGLTFVEGSLKASDGGTGNYEDGKVTAEFGEVTDTEWRTVTFEATINAGYSGEKIKNVALVEVPNIEIPDEPETEIDVDPKQPKTESEKSAELLEKADGNTDADNPEVGDTLKYTIQTRNTIEDSLIANLTIRDVIPEGLEYVPGTLKVNGEAVTDENDDDEGHVVDGEVFASFGNVTDTEWHTLEFQVIVSEGQAGNDIENVAVVDGDNLDEPDEPREEVKVYPREPKLESKKSAKNADESKNGYEVGDTVVYTIETRNTVSDSLVEDLRIIDKLPEGLVFVEGSLQVSDGGTGNYEDGTVTGEFGDVTDTEWRTVTFEAKIESGFINKKIKNVATVGGGNIDEPDEPETEVDVDPKEPKLESKKSAKNADESKDGYEVGDTVVYTIESRNTVEDSIVEDFTIADQLPEGLAFVEGSLQVSDGGTGNYEDGTVTGEFGDVTDTEWRTVTFEAKIESGFINKTIKNVATVGGGNIDEPDEPETEVDVDPKEPKLESKKSAKNADESKDGYEVGDTVVYTIESRNTVEDSIVEDFTITDQLPEGLSFVEGSLQVSDGGTGNYEDGTVTGEFGDVTDTEWRTVTFEAKIESGFINKTIKNVATVGGGNIDEPDEPETEVDVDPKEPKLESKKSAKNADESKDGYEVGDTVVYTIESRNTVEDSIVEDFTITDQLPEGLAFVEGSLQVSDGGTGNYEDGTVTGEFGDVTDTEWRTVTFEAKIESGFINKTIKNVATVGGGNIDEPDEPETEVDVDPKEPKTESEKSAELLEKADGNTDADNPEVGDTLKYTIQTRNTIEDSLIANLTIRDAIPEGLEYVPGTLKVNGEAVTDEDDSDQGHVVDGEVFASFGDVTDTEWRTVEFHVIVSEGQAGKDIENVAVVDGDNIDEPDEPREEVKVYPREPKLESKKSAKNADENKKGYEVGDTVVYTIESRNTVSDSLLENLKITDVLPEGLTFVEGSLKVSDGGTGNYKDGTVTAEFGEVKDTDWRTVTFEATIDSGYSGEKIKNVAVVEVPNLEKPDEPETEVDVDPKDPKTESEKSAELLEKADGNTDADNPEVGDTLKYTIQTRNTVEDSLLANLTIRDAIPAGLEYVPGTLKVNGEAVTDENDDDKGHVVDGEVFASFGNVTDTEWHTVEFHVIVSEGQAGKDIENVAVVDGDNIDEPDEPREEVKVYPREPKLEYEKTAKNADEAKERYEAGDTVVYTIRARNTVSDSLLDNMTFTDELPEGLTFVEGSLEASHDGTGSYKDGKVTAEFGEVKDTEWRTITFEATINAGYAEETIRNVAVIEVPNIEIPGEPDTEIVVDPKQPKLESKKSAKNADESKDGYEVGDTVVYTIEARNTVEDSLVEDLRITDQLPEGLAFVEGSLKVSEGGEGSFEDGTVTATFGNVTDTEWHTVTFEATIEPGFANKTVKNVATVGGGNIDDPDKPEQEVDVDPKQPKLESEKSAKNADESKDGYEVGDTVVYTIETRNTVEDSLVEDLRITDQLPEGLAFVEGSLKVSEGGEGSFEDGTVTATFGNVTDTEWRTVTFEATIEPGFANKTVKNVATVDGGNIDDPDKPEQEVDVDPKQPKLESKKSAKNADESKDGYEVGDTVVYTIEARNTVEDSAVEDLTIIDQLPEGLAFVEGSLEVSEGGEGSFEDGTVTATFGNVTDTEWRTVTFEATIESGTSIKNVATVNGGNIDDPDKPEAEIDINEPPTSPTPDDGDDKEDPVEPTPGDKPEEPKPGNDGTDKPQVPPGKVGSDQPQDKGDATPGDKSPSDGTKLPKTATSTYNLLLIGASLLVLGAILWFVRRKKAA